MRTRYLLRHWPKGTPHDDASPAKKAVSAAPPAKALNPKLLAQATRISRTEGGKTDGEPIATGMSASGTDSNLSASAGSSSASATPATGGPESNAAVADNEELITANEPSSSLRCFCILLFAFFSAFFFLLGMISLLLFQFFLWFVFLVRSAASSADASADSSGRHAEVLVAEPCTMIQPLRKIPGKFILTSSSVSFSGDVCDEDSVNIEPAPSHSGLSGSSGGGGTGVAGGGHAGASSTASGSPPLSSSKSSRFVLFVLPLYSFFVVASCLY